MGEGWRDLCRNEESKKGTSMHAGTWGNLGAPCSPVASLLSLRFPLMMLHAGWSAH